MVVSVNNKNCRHRHQRLRLKLQCPLYKYLSFRARVNASVDVFTLLLARLVRKGRKQVGIFESHINAMQFGFR